MSFVHSSCLKQHTTIDWTSHRTPLFPSPSSSRTCHPLTFICSLRPPFIRCSSSSRIFASSSLPRAHSLFMLPLLLILQLLAVFSFFPHHHPQRVIRASITLRPSHRKPSFVSRLHVFVSHSFCCSSSQVSSFSSSQIS